MIVGAEIMYGYCPANRRFYIGLFLSYRQGRAALLHYAFPPISHGILEQETFGLRLTTFCIDFLGKIVITQRALTIHAYILGVWVEGSRCLGSFELALRSQVIVQSYNRCLQLCITDPM